MTPKSKLSNPYYFIKNNTVFKISSSNETKDSCGKHYVTYKTDPERMVKKGETYIDLHGDYVTAKNDATNVVSTGSIDAETSSKTFPYFKITGLSDGNETEHYLWLDDFITDGDVIVTDNDNVKFMRTKHSENPNDESGYVDFAEDYVNTVKEELAAAIVNGKDFDAAKRSYPPYLFVSEGDRVKIDRNVIDVSEVKSSFEIESLPIISEEGLTDTIYELLNGMVKTYANGVLKNVGMKLTDDAEALITDSNTEDI